MASSALKAIADKITPQLGGINWAALESKFGMTREQVVYHTDPSKPSADIGLFQYQIPIRAAFDRAELALKDVVLSWSVTDNPATRKSEIVEAMNALKSVEQDLGDISGALESALNSNFTFLGANDELQMNREHYRAVVSTMYMTCLRGTVIHANGIMQFNELSPDIIINSADSIVRGFNALSLLAEGGALDSLKINAMTPKSPMSGLGVAPIVWAAVIAIAVVFFAAIIAWCVVERERQSAVNELVKNICDDALKSGDPTKYGHCIELAKINAAAATVPPNPGDWVEKIGKAALWAGVAFLLVWSTPTIVRAVSMKLDERSEA